MSPSHHIARQSRLILETTVTGAELLPRALDRGRLPSKRFRVEGSRVGASSLVTDKQANDTRAAYGGVKVEVLTLAVFLPAQAKHLDLPPCPRKACSAEAGAPCSNKGGLCSPHKRRLEPGPEEAAKQLPECPTCSVHAGSPCTTKKGKIRMPHQARLPDPAAGLPVCPTCAALAGQTCRSGAARKACKPHKARLP